jgi:hypothetical protein
MHLDGEAWVQYLHNFAHDAFRLETHSVYRVPQEAETFRRFLAGEPLSEDDKKGWLDQIREHVAAGRRVCRVHVLRRPLTDYLRYEFEHYRINAAAGEVIQILDLTDRPNPGLPDQDFWMFDDTRVVLMHYDVDGRQTGRHVYSGDPEPFVEWKRLALERSVPFTEYIQDLR